LVWNLSNDSWYHRRQGRSHDQSPAESIRSRLPPPRPEQEELAAAILEELAADERWEATFAESQSALKRLADEALKEHRAGRTEGLDPDAL